MRRRARRGDVRKEKGKRIKGKRRKERGEERKGKR